MRAPGALCESDGMGSMRRFMAAGYGCCSWACLLASAISGSGAGVQAGAVALVGVLVLLGYTTVADIVEIAHRTGKDV